MVNLTRIYTRTGDSGTTRLSDNSVAAKTDPRVCAYGTVDELNSNIGALIAWYELPTDVAEMATIIQNELFDLGADLSNPVVADPPHEPLRIIAESITRLEDWCDRYNENLTSLRSFILPGGTRAAAQANICRSIARRAEREAWAAAEIYGLVDENAQPEGGVNALAIRYLNRLSDLLFILGRYLNAQEGGQDILWVPGGERNPKT